MEDLHMEGVINGEGTPAIPPVENKPVTPQVAPASEGVISQPQGSNEIEIENAEIRMEKLKKQRDEARLERDDARASLLSQEATKEAIVDDDSSGGTDEALKIVEDIAQKKADEATASIRREMDLDRVAAKYDDFYSKSDQIKELVKVNPLLSFEQAYKLVKFDGAQENAKQQGVTEGQKQAQNLNSATVEGGAGQTSPSVATGSDEIDPLAKGIDGKYLYSMDELEGVLPKTKNE